MGPCIVSIFPYTCISNKMQRYTIYLYLETALHVSGGTSTHHQEPIQLYLQHLVFLTPLLLSAAIVEELGPVWESTLVAYATHSRNLRHVSERVNGWLPESWFCHMYNPKVSIRPSHLLRRVALELVPKPQNTYKKWTILLKFSVFTYRWRHFLCKFLSSELGIKDEDNCVKVTVQKTKHHVFSRLVVLI
jgi:hypothetical protein